MIKSPQDYPNSGFTLLEVLVALVLISGLGMALFSWVNTSLKIIDHIEKATEKNEITLTALELLKTNNPQTNPTGEYSSPPYQIKWSSVPISGPIRGISSAGGPGYYQVGLYLLTCEIFKQEKPLSVFSIRQIGYRQAVFNPKGF